MKMPVLVLALAAGLVLAGAVGAASGYEAAAMNRVAGPSGPMGPAGPTGIRGPAGPEPATVDSRGGICVAVATEADYNAIPRRVYVTDLKVWSPTAGACPGGSYVAVG